MNVVYYRNCKCGLGSNLVNLCIAILIDRPYKIKADIDISNYNCKWEDLFISEDVYAKSRNIKRPKYSLFCRMLTNKAYYDPVILGKLNRIWNKHINIQSYIVDKVNELSKKYNIPNSTCLYFRGTDKKTEVKRALYDDYLPHIPAGSPVYVQSDEKEFIDFVKVKYPKSFEIPEVNRNNDSSLPIHLRKTTNIQDAIDILIILHLMAKCKNLVANISNVTQCSLIIRGNQDGYFCIQ